MGSPRYPTQSQIKQLQQESKLPPPQTQPLPNGSLTLELPVNGLAVIEVK
jgi:xylan 1,4-beta-xylosidase